MSQHVAPPLVLIPETAPFSADQRSWLSGYFAALLGPAVEGATALAAGETPSGPALADNGDAPWHDPSMVIGDRMELAKDRSEPQKLMAAMAQQDCGQCGYNCADYANAIFLKSEARLNLCQPGGKDTLRMLKRLEEEFGASGGGVAPASADAAAAAEAPLGPLGYCRENPVEATFLSRTRLNAPGGEKETWHIEIDLKDTPIEYVVGDSLGLFPANAPALVDAVIAELGARPERIVGGKTLRQRLLADYSLGAAPDGLYQLLSLLTSGEARRKAQALATGEDPDGDAAYLDVLGALHKFPGARPDAEVFLETLDELQPRLYSISSSPKADPGRVSLTVDAVRYNHRSRLRLGVASTHLGERMPETTKVKVYLQKAHGFALPDDLSKDVIMCGPGTGIAPFRAFLRERAATKAPGRNWLFYGHQRQASDFFYKDELTKLRDDKVLTRLSLAWSRDGAEKTYVQDRMRENGADLWKWLEGGAHFYVCGDAKRMAKDVERAIIDVAAAHGGKSPDEAVAYLAGLKKAGRYQADVY
ncbi:MULTISPECIES: sulfite reductase subunit alpha [Methylobacterium]|uniref:Ion-translocating oxidoreductase complex subunit B n=4 Tax=Pseudomonadota TaxID=1224 RepID=A0ABQ4SP32_9HYPH|nr:MULTISPECIES: sulfite reductase subunit alpha [Methylobacterium]PIU04746.1 MAG: sulfite reductase subunit alpha [Methylobacterium sp. CG09_land_8_20_14_0_10_71_15]PIU13448.1 MAG: sulfite reductase subunit alpha [Methylobacterium sp. CG08_land_8_20_14_0_20_71_15]GBU17666.1 sulfite reductase [Methylobacterium sp.]GJE04842.1 Ion-translocating oxidoreductase complex subunit B [Methylobacterium jeotgali]